jgi:hypothetical protein
MDEFGTGKYFMTGADVVITPNLPLPNPASEDDFNLQTTHVVCHHQQAERGKYRNRDRTEKTTDDQGVVSKVKVPGHKIIQELNERNILLYAFTVDPLGHTGPMARTLLYGEASIIDPLAANLHPESQLAHTRATAPDSIRGILPIANDRWKQQKGDRWFAPAYQHILPSQWAHQIMHLNITLALTSHIQRCSHVVSKKFSTQRRPYTRGQNSPHRDFTTKRTRTTLNTVPNTMRAVSAATCVTPPHTSTRSNLTSWSQKR